MSFKMHVIRSSQILRELEPDMAKLYNAEPVTADDFLIDYAVETMKLRNKITTRGWLLLLALLAWIGLTVMAIISVYQLCVGIATGLLILGAVFGIVGAVVMTLSLGFFLFPWLWDACVSYNTLATRQEIIRALRQQRR